MELQSRLGFHETGRWLEPGEVAGSGVAQRLAELARYRVVISAKSVALRLSVSREVLADSLRTGQ